jgi:hypothetical protein
MLACRSALVLPSGVVCFDRSLSGHPRFQTATTATFATLRSASSKVGRGLINARCSGHNPDRRAVFRASLKGVDDCTTAKLQASAGPRSASRPRTGGLDGTPSWTNERSSRRHDARLILKGRRIVCIFLPHSVSCAKPQPAFTWPVWAPWRPFRGNQSDAPAPTYTRQDPSRSGRSLHLLPHTLLHTVTPTALQLADEAAIQPIVL